MTILMRMDTAYIMKTPKIITQTIFRMCLGKLATEILTEKMAENIIRAIFRQVIE